MSALLLGLFVYAQDDKGDSEVFPANTEATSPAVARTVREHLHLSRPSGKEKTVRMTVDGILRGQHYNSVAGTLDFLDDEGEVVDRVPFLDGGLADGRIESSTSKLIPNQRLDDIATSAMPPGPRASDRPSR